MAAFLEPVVVPALHVPHAWLIGHVVLGDDPGVQAVGQTEEEEPQWWTHLPQQESEPEG